MRKLSNLLMAVLLAVGLAVPASSATLTATGALGVSLGALPAITIGGGPVLVFVSSGTGAFVLPASVFQATVNLATQLFTGVNLISSLNVNATNLTVTQVGGAATGAVVGTAIVGVLGGLINLNIALNVGGGGVTTGGAASLKLTITNATGWTTGAVSVTGITTTTVGTAVVNTLVASGSDTRTTGHAGMITLVTPTRVLTNAAGNLPLIGSIKLIFSGATPEPGTLLLLGSGVIGLAVLGRRRMRK